MEPSPKRPSDEVAVDEQSLKRSCSAACSDPQGDLVLSMSSLFDAIRSPTTCAEAIPPSPPTSLGVVTADKLRAWYGLLKEDKDTICADPSAALGFTAEMKRQFPALALYEGALTGEGEGSRTTGADEQHAVIASLAHLTMCYMAGESSEHLQQAVQIFESANGFKMVMFGEEKKFQAPTASTVSSYTKFVREFLPDDAHLTLCFHVLVWHDVHKIRSVYQAAVESSHAILEDGVLRSCLVTAAAIRSYAEANGGINGLSPEGVELIAERFSNERREFAQGLQMESEPSAWTNLVDDVQSAKWFFVHGPEDIAGVGHKLPVPLGASKTFDNNTMNNMCTFLDMLVCGCTYDEYVKCKAGDFDVLSRIQTVMSGASGAEPEPATRPPLYDDPHDVQVFALRLFGMCRLGHDDHAWKDKLFSCFLEALRMAPELMIEAAAVLERVMLEYFPLLLKTAYTDKNWEKMLPTAIVLAAAAAVAGHSLFETDTININLIVRAMKLYQQLPEPLRAEEWDSTLPDCPDEPIHAIRELMVCMHKLRMLSWNSSACLEVPISSFAIACMTNVLRFERIHERVSCPRLAASELADAVIFLAPPTKSTVLTFKRLVEAATASPTPTKLEVIIEASLVGYMHCTSSVPDVSKLPANWRVPYRTKKPISRDGQRLNDIESFLDCQQAMSESMGEILALCDKHKLPVFFPIVERDQRPTYIKLDGVAGPQPCGPGDLHPASAFATSKKMLDKVLEPAFTSAGRSLGRRMKSSTDYGATYAADCLAAILAMCLSTDCAAWSTYRLLSVNVKSGFHTKPIFGRALDDPIVPYMHASFEESDDGCFHALKDFSAELIDGFVHTAIDGYSSATLARQWNAVHVVHDDECNDVDDWGAIALLRAASALCTLECVYETEEV